MVGKINRAIGVRPEFYRWGLVFSESPENIQLAGHVREMREKCYKRTYRIIHANL